MVFRYSLCCDEDKWRNFGFSVFLSFLRNEICYEYELHLLYISKSSITSCYNGTFTCVYFIHRDRDSDTFLKKNNFTAKSLPVPNSEADKLDCKTHAGSLKAEKTAAFPGKANSEGK